MNTPTHETRGPRRIWTGIAAGVLTVAVLGGVAAGAYRAGERSDRTIEVIERSATEGDVARTVVVDGPWRDGPGPGIIIFPLLVIGLIALFASRRGPGRGWGPRPMGMEPGGFDDWHRHAHVAAGAPLTPTSSPTTGATRPADDAGPPPAAPAT